MVGHAGSHREGALRAVESERLVHSAEVVVHVVERHDVAQVLDLLGESVGEPGEAADPHPQSEALALDVAGRDSGQVRGARVLLDIHDLARCRRVPACLVRGPCLTAWVPPIQTDLLMTDSGSMHLRGPRRPLELRRRRPRDWTLAFALVIAAGTGSTVMGCSASHRATDAPSAITVVLPASATPPDPCSLLTTVQVSAAFGQQVSDGRSGPPLKPYGQRVCVWHGGRGMVTLTIETDAGVDAASQQGNGERVRTVAEIYGGATPLTFDNVSDIGDRARLVNPGTSPSIFVLVGHTLVQLAFADGPNGGQKWLVPLAGQAASVVSASATTTGD